ncbi:thiamine pyrophosphokinase 2-like [Gastrolobium bilobum]|uniref:thiamine pyrophosphokinase 2-like n=1 Tax=Gastrolobium bilobum TaxID=150636 RepID=UPI002AB08F88|nr:thiamine pyrophosphokinase 2-like [Gastrolobium bilobum]
MELMSHCSSFLLPPEKEKPNAANSTCSLSVSYALVVLNQCLPRFAPLLWDHAQIRVCADGGANRVYDEMPLLFPHQHPSHVRTRFSVKHVAKDGASCGQRGSRLGYYISS